MQLADAPPGCRRFRGRSAARPASTISAFWRPCPCAGLILQGDKDEIVPEPLVAKLSEKLSKQRGLTMDYRVVPGADHFFQNMAPTVHDHIIDHVSGKMGLALAQVAE